MDKSDAPLETIATGSRFLSSTVHEMRTPIQTIIGSLELLKMTSLDKEQTEYVHQMQVGADTLFALANDILDFTKIRSEKFKLENIEFNLIEVLERVMDSVSNEAFSKGLELVSDIYTSVPKYIIGDPTRLQQILLNIVKNAVKFTDSGYIHTILDRVDENTLMFRIEDTGIGISDGARKKLFTDFYQVDTSTTRKYGGTGLGLSICKALVAAMGGKIGVDPNPQGGSVFWFTVPCVQSHNKALDLRKYRRVTYPDTARILLVDDNFLARKSFERKLKDIGLPYIAAAQSGEEALQMMRDAAIEGNPYTVVFIDMVMPKMDGWRLASEINSDKIINDVKLYLIVPEGQLREDAKMRLLNWFNGYLYKPVKIQKLEELLTQAFSVSIELKGAEQASSASDESGMRNRDDKIAEGVLVLVAEDHPVNRKFIVAFLQKMGASVLEAKDGAVAVETADKNPSIDIVFMDVQMPVMNGLDATLSLRKNGYKGVIVACTANHSDEDIKVYIDSGMNDILGKPYKSDDLKKIILKWKNAFSAGIKQSPAAKKVMEGDTETVWDTADFEDTIGGDSELGKQLIEDFCIQTKKLIEKIPALVRSGNYNELRRTGHTLKGSAATISAISISAHGDALNKAAHAGDKGSLMEEQRFLVEELERFSVAANNWRKMNDPENQLSYTHDFL